MNFLLLLEISGLVYIFGLLFFIVYRFVSKKGMSETLWMGALLSIVLAPFMPLVLFFIAYYEITKRSKSLLSLYKRKARVDDDAFFDFYGVFLTNPVRHWVFIVVVTIFVFFLFPRLLWFLGLALLLWFLVYIFVSLLFVYKHLRKV